MWVAGTLGAFFTALARNLPLHLQERGWPPDIAHTLDLIIRYGYVVWLLAYFFISNLDNATDDTPRNRDLAFDVIQSIAALWAVFWIGFALPGHGYGHDAFGPALVTVNLAVAVICLASLILFSCESSMSVNYLRIAGLVVSVVTIAAVCFGVSGISLLWCGIGALAILIVILIRYVLIRHDSPIHADNLAT